MLRIALAVALLMSCATPPRPEPAPQRETCDAALTRSIQTRLEGDRVRLEETWSGESCGQQLPAPRAVAELSRAGADAACPIGQRPSPEFTATLHPGHLAQLKDALAHFGRNATAYVVECRADGQADWLVLADDGPHVSIGFFSPSDTVVRLTPGHVRVLFPVPEAPPPVTPEPPLAEERDVPDEPPLPGVPAQVTHEGCPPSALAASWSTRAYFTSNLPGPDSVERWQLRLDGRGFTLVSERREFLRRDPDARWRCASSTTWEGSVLRQGRASLLRLGDEVLTCTPKKVSVAPATAKRVALAPLEEDCARHRWSTTQRESRPALVCTSSARTLVFGAGAGFERLVVQADDCGPRDLVFEPLRLATEGDPLPAR